MINKKIINKKKVTQVIAVALCASVCMTGCNFSLFGKNSDTEELVAENESIYSLTGVQEEMEVKTPNEDAKETNNADSKDSKKDDKKNDKTDKNSKDKESTDKGKKKSSEKKVVELDKNVKTENGSENSNSNSSTNAGSSNNSTTNNSSNGNSTNNKADNNSENNNTNKEEKFVLDSSYKLKWSDEFNGTTLNTSDWNVEIHDPGWVNSESQAYVNSTDNIYLKDGNLVIQPLKDAQGNITSGRINTQGNHDYTYGYFECRAKVPTGAGYLPAFWMMPTDENLYGQWPRCGEIDIMEVMGQETDKLYGTIHYGNPHSESQGTKKLTSGSFADEYHTFAVDWQPGSIKWYVDGVLYHEENDWYSTTANVGTVAYPAPFDQPFYMIFNVAAGGSWVGALDDTAKFDESSQLIVDYVRVYQKDSYDENVTKPVKTVVLRDPDANGNYINNGSFANEDITDDVNWKFMTANGGAATATIANNSINIATTAAGSVDYSVQLVQAGVPLKKGGKYTVTFEAKADATRTMGTAVKAPDRSYMAYMSETCSLSTDWQTYTYEFTMTESDDANGRLEFNMGAAGTEGIQIRNVKITKTGQLSEDDLNKKTVLGNGSLVYNGEFQEGADRLEYWNVTNKALVSVTNVNNSRELCVNGNVTVSQSELAFTDGTAYELSFKARGNGSIKATAAGVSQTFTLTDENQTYTLKIPAGTFTDKDLSLEISTASTVYVDDVKIVEDSLIKNGSFDAGMSGYEFYKYSDGLATAVVDSLNESNAADITINNTGDTDWYIQLKQNNITLEKNQWYNLTFKVKSNLARKFMYAIQKDGTNDNDWTPYTGSQVITLAGNGEYETVSLDFQMKKDTDTKSILSFTMGAVGGTAITSQHRICIDDISLTKIDAPVVEITPKKEPGVNMLDELNKDGSAVGTVNLVNNVYTYSIPATGSDEWSTQIMQAPLTLINGKTYRIEFKANSSIDRDIRVLLRDANQGYAGHYDYVSLTANTDKNYSVNYTWNLESTETADFAIFMGDMENGGSYQSEHTVALSDIKVYEVDPNENANNNNNPELPQEQVGANIIGWFGACDGNAAIHATTSTEDLVTIADAGSNPWDIQTGTDNHVYVKGHKYRITMEIESSIDRSVTVALQDSTQGWAGLSDTVNLTGGQNYSYTKDYIWGEAEGINDSSAISLQVKLGNNGTSYGSHTVKISNVSVCEVTETVNQNLPTNMLSNLGTYADSDTDRYTQAVDISNGKYTFYIKDTGSADWHIQLNKENLTLVNGKKYRLSFKVKSTVARKIKESIVNPSYAGHWGGDINLNANEEYTYSVDYDCTTDTTNEEKFTLYLGKVGEDSNLGEHVIEVYDISLVEVE